MDQAPYLLAGGRWGYRMGDGQIFDSMLRDGLNDAFSGQHSGWHAEDLVEKYQITREAQDAWAVRSQQCFGAAQAAGKFKDEIVALELPGRKGPTPRDLRSSRQSARPREAVSYRARSPGSSTW